MTKLKENVQIVYSHANPPKAKPEPNDGSSLTNPDAGLSIRQMVERYVRGEDVPQVSTYYDDNVDAIIPQDADLSDVTAAVEEGKQALANHKAEQVAKKAKLEQDRKDQDTEGDSNNSDFEGQRTKSQKAKRSAAKSDESVPPKSPKSPPVDGDSKSGEK